MQAVKESALRVAIVSDSESQRTNLRLMLERSGVQVVINSRLEAELFKRLNANIADVLLIDLDEELDEDEELLDELVDMTPVPILFNDSAATRQLSMVYDASWGRKLANKLASLVDGTQMSVGNAGHKIALETPEYVANRIPEAPSAVVTGKQPGSSELSNVWVLAASIGGPQSLKRFISCIPEDLPVAFIVAQHIGTNFVSLLAEQLGKVTPFSVYPARSGEVFAHQQVVITPVGERLNFGENNEILLEPTESTSIYSPCIDMVLTDTSKRYGAATGAIIFSGMGNDSMQGCMSVASRDGLVWAQDPDSCVVSSMPDHARRAGVVSFSGSPEELAQNLVKHLS